MDTGCDAQTSSQDPSDSPSASVNRRVLIVDDSLSIHEDFHKILMPSQNLALSQVEDQLFGSVPPRPLQVFSLDSAFQGREALAMVESALARDTPYAMAFIDMRMPPGWDGLETIEQLWKVDPDLQIALCTAYSDYSWETMAERLAFGDQLLILKKPFDSLEIRQMASALTWKWQMTQDARHKLDDLQRTIEERVAELLKVSHLLHYDTLTGLPSSALLGDRLGQRDRAGVGQRAQVAAGAGDHVGEQADVGLGHAQAPCGLPQRGQVAFSHPGQQQVLLVRDAHFTGAETVGEVGGGVELVGGGVARRMAQAFERQRDRAQGRVFVGAHVLGEPALVVG